VIGLSFPIGPSALTTHLGSGKVTFNTINRTEWAFPQDIDLDKAYRRRIMMKELGLESDNTIDGGIRANY
jgi:hypothetical protein